MADFASQGLENKIIAIFDKLNEKYQFGEKYLLSFHTDNYGGEAFYDSALETHEDAGAYMVRMTGGKFVTIPKQAIADFDNPNFMSTWGDKINATVKIPQRKS